MAIGGRSGRIPRYDICGHGYLHVFGRPRPRRANIAPANNILCDTGSCVYGGERSIESFVRSFGAERLLLGTDGEAALNLQIVRNAQLSPEEKQLILFGNAKKLLNL